MKLLWSFSRAFLSRSFREPSGNFVSEVSFRGVVPNLSRSFRELSELFQSLALPGNRLAQRRPAVVGFAATAHGADARGKEMT